jgi:phosphohistidine phosphatase
MLLRHAKSSWASSGMQDAARSLSGRGEAAARLMGGYMAHHSLIPDRVLCSPARRTRDTWAGIAAQWPANMDVVFDQRLYEATPQTILSVIGDQDDAARTLLVIGHNPGLQEAAELLIAAGDVELRERLREKFPTAALAVIDFAIDKWKKRPRALRPARPLHHAALGRGRDEIEQPPPYPPPLAGPQGGGEQ